MNTNLFLDLEIHLFSTSLFLFVNIRVHSWLKLFFLNAYDTYTSILC
jgi:hypothetical protein